MNSFFPSKILEWNKPDINILNSNPYSFLSRLFKNSFALLQIALSVVISEGSYLYYLTEIRGESLP